MHSEHDKPLLGDLVVVFSDDDQVPEFSSWIIPVFVVATLSSVLPYAKRKKAFFAFEKGIYVNHT